MNRITSKTVLNGEDFYISGYRQYSASLEEPVSFSTAVAIKKKSLEIGKECFFYRRRFKEIYDEIVFIGDIIQIKQRMWSNWSLRNIKTSDITKAKWSYSKTRL